MTGSFVAGLAAGAAEAAGVEVAGLLGPGDGVAAGRGGRGWLVVTPTLGTGPGSLATNCPWGGFDGGRGAGEEEAPEDGAGGGGGGVCVTDAGTEGGLGG